MDTELARTFLTVVTAGNFITAAERLHVSQSTVSTRIHTLEEQLGCTLFVRNKAGTTLTPAGRQFQRHASALVRTVEQARHDVGIPKGFSGTLVIGGRIGLWEEYLLRWVPLMQGANPEISIRAESALEPELMQGLVEGRIDIGVMYTPQSRPGLKVEQLFEEHLILVSTDPNSDAGAAARLCLCRLGAGVLRPAQRLLPEFRRSCADGEHRLAGAAARPGKRRLRILRAPDRRAAVEVQAASCGGRRAGIFDAGLCCLSARPGGRSCVARGRDHAPSGRANKTPRRAPSVARARGADRPLRISYRSNRLQVSEFPACQSGSAGSHQSEGLSGQA